MNIDEIREVAKLMREYKLSEFSIEADGCNLCIRREKDGVETPVPVVYAAPQAVQVQAPVETPVETPAPAAEKAEKAETRESIDSPLVGTFFRAASPDAPPFVTVGDKVTADTVVAIIEAMKVMNEVKAEKSGVIKEILAENGQPVEYGQPLFIIG